MTSVKLSSRKGLKDWIRRSFIEYTSLWVFLMVTSGMLLIVSGGYIQQIRYTLWAPSCISIGSTLISIGIVVIFLKSAAVLIMNKVIVKDTVVATIEEIEQIYIPKMIIKHPSAIVRVLTSKNNQNIPKMNVSVEKTLRNLHEQPVDQRREEIYLHSDQEFEIKNIEVSIRGIKFHPHVPIKGFQITPLDTQKNDEYDKKYVYYIPFVSPLNKGEDVSIKEEFEWSPCKAKPDESDKYDEFAYQLSLPAEDMRIKMIAEEKFYFTSLEKKSL